MSKAFEKSANSSVALTNIEFNTPKGLQKKKKRIAYASVGCHWNFIEKQIAVL